MFANNDNNDGDDCVEFHSRKTDSGTLRSFKDASQQTVDSLSTDVEIQTSYKENRQVQTDQSLDISTSSNSYDHKSLAEFLGRITPQVMVELEKNLNCHVFDDCLHINTTLDDDDAKSKLLYTLICDKVDCDIEQLSCSDITWNSTGSIVGISYGCINHEHGDCTQKQRFATWNLDRNNFCSSKSSFYFEEDYCGCLTALKFHPVMPSIIAGITCEGFLSIWDLSNKSECIKYTNMDIQDDKTGPGTSLHWVNAGVYGKYHVVTSNLKGYIYVYDLQNRKLEVAKRFKIMNDAVPEPFRSNLNSKQRLFSIGVIDMSFYNDNTDLFGAALECGLLVQCSLKSTRLTSKLYDEQNSCAPVEFVHLPHKGNVTSIGCSPFESNLMASCSSDGELRFYSLMQPGSPVMIFNHDDPLESLCWSPVCPLLLATASSTGEIIIFKIQRDRCNVEHRFGSNESSMGYSKLLFNHRDVSLMASISKGKEAHVWRLGSELLQSEPEDSKLLNELCKSMQ